MDWIKLMCNILDHRKIKMIRKGPEGDTLVLLWLLMLAEAGKCNRGGYLMISNSRPYTAETLSMVTDIKLPTVQLGLGIYEGFEMIDRQDSLIYIKNWSKYQSEDKLEARREKDRERKQKQRQKERKNLRLPEPAEMSRDSHDDMSRDITPENRTDNRTEEDTTTEQVRLLLSGTPFSKISEQELCGLAKRHGLERLLSAADVAAETWKRTHDDKRNPGGYLNSLCAALVVPEWYVPFAERTKQSEAAQQRKARVEATEAELKAQEKSQELARNVLWESLSDEQREEYRSAALAGMQEGLVPSVGVIAKARLLAWEALYSCPPEETTDQNA